MNNYFSNSELKSMFESYLTDEQILMINEPTPPEYIEMKKDEDGHQYKSVKAYYVKKRLNLIFGFGWNFKVVRGEYYANAGECIVHGKLTVPTTRGKITREQYGKSTVEFSKRNSRTTSAPSNMGNALKASASDALKKCASELGICWDIYSQERPEKKTTSNKMKKAVTKKTIDLP